MDMPAAQQAQFVEAWNRAIQPIADALKRVWEDISKAVQAIAKALQHAGLHPKRTRRPKRRSRLRSRVALKRKGLWTASVWA